MNRHQDGISVIICCYNSALRLPQTLKHIAQQVLSASISREVIIINNASDDNTAKVAKEEWARHNITNTPFKVIEELKPGLSNARDKGVETSQYNYIVFCDDDNWLDKHYLQIAYDTLTAKTAVAALGGQSQAVADVNLPDWFEASKNNYAIGKQAVASGDVSYRKHLWGSGIIIRKDVYEEAFAGFPSLLTGRKGMELSSGEDSEMCMRFILMGYQIFYLETLKLKHYVHQERLTIDYSNRLMDGFIKAHAVLSIYARFIDLKMLPYKEKLLLILKSSLKIGLMYALKLKRWNEEDEKIQVFILTGYRFKSIPAELGLVRRLSAVQQHII